METDWDALGMDMNLDDPDFIDPAFDMPQFTMPVENPSILAGDFFSHELLALGLEEPLPPQDMMDELFVISREILCRKYSQWQIRHLFRKIPSNHADDAQAAVLCFIRQVTQHASSHMLALRHVDNGCKSFGKVF